MSLNRQIGPDANADQEEDMPYVVVIIGVVLLLVTLLSLIWMVEDADQMAREFDNYMREGGGCC